MSLPEWRKNGWLKSHTPSAHEITQLLAGSDRDLADAAVPGLSGAWKFSIAYNSILQAGAAALAAAGYRAERELHHYRVLQSLRHTIGLDQDTLERLDVCRRKRHKSVYEAVDAVSDHEVREILAMARDLRARVGAWLKANHPNVLKPPR